MCMKAEAQGGPEGIRINAKKKKKRQINEEIKLIN